MGPRDWFRKTPAGRVVPRVEFIGEQDGENERELKARLEPLLARDPRIQRAYLARAGFEPAEATSVVLCLISSSGDDSELLKQIDAVFRTLAPPNAFLDVAFLTEAREEDVARVCRPFYQRAADAH